MVSCKGFHILVKKQLLCTFPKAIPLLLKALYYYTAHFVHTSGPLFQFLSGVPVKHRFISQQLRKLVPFIDPNQKQYSFQIGAATHSESLGFA